MNEVNNVWCETCDFPMCSSDCSAAHISMPECIVISRHKPMKINKGKLALTDMSIGTYILLLFSIVLPWESFLIFTDGTTTTTFVKSQENGIYWNQDIWNIDYQAILPLRCLLAKHSASWNYLQNFMDHCEVRIFGRK